MDRRKSCRLHCTHRIRRTDPRSRRCRRKCRRHPHPHLNHRTRHKRQPCFQRSRMRRLRCLHRHTRRTHRGRFRHNRMRHLQCQSHRTRHIRPYTNKSHRQWWLLRSCKQWRPHNRCKKSCHRCTRHKRPSHPHMGPHRHKCRPHPRRPDKNHHTRRGRRFGHKNHRRLLQKRRSCRPFRWCNRALRLRHTRRRRLHRSSSCRRSPSWLQLGTCKNHRRCRHPRCSCKPSRRCNLPRACLCRLQTSLHHQRPQTFGFGRRPLPMGRSGSSSDQKWNPWW